LKEIRLKNLIIENFKGIKSLHVDFDGKSVNVYGTNETGKTTIIDAFTWCLFGKDSLGSSNFALKPRDEFGNERLGLEPTVEVTLLIDGSEKSFKKTWAEIYKKKRGHEGEYSGNESKCYVNGVPVSVTQYQKEIDEVISEKLFKLITNVNHFINLHWRDQREILFQLVPDISDLEIIDANPELKSLAKILNGRKVEDLKEIYKEKNKRINKELESLPDRIDELNKPEYPLVKSDVFIYDIENKLDKCYDKLKEVEANKAAVSNVSEINKHQETILGFKDDLLALEEKKNDLIQKALEEKRAEIDKIKWNLRKLQSERDDLNITNATLQKRIENGNCDIENEKARRQNLLDQYHEERKKVFTPENCSYCGQALPQEKIAELEKQFNLENAQKQEKIVEQGKVVADRIKSLQADIDKWNEERNVTLEKIAELDDLISDFTSKLNAAEIELKNIKVDTSETDAEIEKIQERIKIIENVVSRLRTKTDASIYDQTIKELKSEIAYLSDAKAQCKLKEQNDARIAELEAQHKKLKSEYEDNLTIIELCERFTSVKAEYLESKINANFEIVKFELFKKYLNSGIEDTCVATVLSADGNYVPYASANNANKINAGLDIIRTLQKINDVKAPIFIDNAESTVRFLNVDSQLIRLYVSENDKTLRIEKGE